MNANSGTDLLQLTADIVSAYATRNQVVAEELPGLIRSVFATLGQLGGNVPAAEAAPPREPAVPIEESVFPDHIVCLEDGKKRKTLKRHLMSAYGMTADDYRRKWGLPKTYPMVAPKYAAAQSSFAKEGGLGRKPQAGELIELSKPIVQQIPDQVLAREVTRKKAA